MVLGTLFNNILNIAVLEPFYNKELFKTMKIITINNYELLEDP